LVTASDGTFGVEKGSGTFAVTDAEADTTELLSGVDYLAVGATITEASIGGSGGLSLGTFSLAMLMVNDDSPVPVKYTAIKASLGPPDFGALPAGLVIDGSLGLEINKSSDAANPDRVLDFVDTPGFLPDVGKAGLIDVTVGPDEVETLSMDGNLGELLRISASRMPRVTFTLLMQGAKQPTC
jgi:hypothetical protein